MAMDENGSIGIFGYIILFVIVVVVIWLLLGGLGGFGGFGGCNNGRFNNGCCSDMAFQDFKEICNNEKADISRTATTQFLIEQQSANNRELIAAQTNAINTKIDYYGYQNERDKNAQLQRENMELRNQLFTKDQLAPINAAIASIQCNMLRRPDVTGIGVACPSAAILNGLGVNHINQRNNDCGCHGNVI